MKDIRLEVSPRVYNIILEFMKSLIRDDNEPYTDKEFLEFMNDYMIARGF